MSRRQRPGGVPPGVSLRSQSGFAIEQMPERVMAAVETIETLAATCRELQRRLDVLERRASGDAPASGKPGA